MRRAGSNEQPSRLLIVDDDPLIRLVARERLTAAGFEVVEAEGGEQGVEAFRTLMPDLILLDVEMPGLDGFGACEQIRATGPGQHVPILILTGLHDVVSIERAYDVGATDFVSKPLNWVLLAHRIRYMLRASESFDEVRSQQVRLDQVQQYARLGSWELDLSTGLLSGSRALRALLGLADDIKLPPAGELLEWVHPEDRDGIATLIGEAIRERTGFSMDHRIVRGDGSERIAHTEGRVRGQEDQRALALEGFTQDITERRRAEEQIRFLAYSDSLTGLSNRTAFKTRLRAEIQRAKRTDTVVAILFLDLDHFKRINDTFGHSVGDLVLQRVADQLISCVRGTDYVARGEGGSEDVMISRLGGDEFTILLEGLSDPSEAGRVASRILEFIARPILVEGREVLLTASMGIAVWPNDGEDEGALLRNAESAMYHAKELGRACFQFYREALNADALEQLELEGRLHRAIRDDDLLVYYQPKLELASGRITGCEALVRWLTPDGLVPPNEFIPLAETTGMISALGESVLRKACRQARAWQERGHPDFRLAVNLSPRQLRDERLVETIEAVLRETCFDPRLLELEITESALIYHEEQSLAVLEELRLRGIEISLDDFGTGYSSLSYLKRFPVQTLKIDMSFIAGIGRDPDDETITAAILSMARDLRLLVVAEGIETDEQLRFLKDRDCDEVQGYLISRPLPADAFESFLGDQTP